MRDRRRSLVDQETVEIAANPLQRIVIAYGDGDIHNAQNIEATAFRLQIATWALGLGILLLVGLLRMG